MAPRLDPTNQSFIDAVADAGGPKIYELSFDEARDVLENAQRHTPASDVSVETFDVPRGPTGHVKTVLYKPAGSQGNLPTFFYIHGGGWILGSPNTHDRLIRDLVRESGLACVFPYYTPAPDKQFPVQFEECYAVLKYIAEHGASKGLDTSKFAVAGDSVGGQMAIATSALSAERNGPKIVYQALLYPVTNIAEESNTYQQFRHGPGLEVATLKWMIAAFAPYRDDRLGHLASPLLSHHEQLVRLPPTLIVTAGVDPLRAEGEEFGHVLQKAGVPTAVFRAHGQVHDFAMLNGTATSPAAVATIELVALKLRKALR